LFFLLSPPLHYHHHPTTTTSKIITMGGSHELEKGSFHEHTPAQALLGESSRTNKLANPGVLGLFSFASTTFILSLYNLQTRGITEPNLVVGMAIFCGGLGQLLAGMWEFPKGNTFGATAFSSYGAFWLSYATILLPGSGIIAAYGENVDQLTSAIGIYLTCWCIVTVFFGIATLGKGIAFIALFGFLAVTFAVLANGAFGGVAMVTKAGGALGVITAFIAYYIGLSELLSAEENPVFTLPLGSFNQKRI